MYSVFLHWLILDAIIKRNIHYRDEEIWNGASREAPLRWIDLDPGVSEKQEIATQ